MAKKNSIDNKTGDLTIDPGASGDSWVQFDINTVGEFRIGVDDDDADKFKISQGSALGTNDTFTMTAAGERLMPLQPCFLSQCNAEANASGDSTAHTIGSITADTEIFDQGGDYTPGDGAGTGGVFTASVTGRYLLSFVLTVDIDPTGGDDMFSYIVTSNRTYYCQLYPTENQATGFYGLNGDISMTGTVIADMDASDTASYRWQSRFGAKTDDIVEGYISGALLV